jgi:hypothetical protein
MPRSKIIEELHGLHYDSLNESIPDRKAELELRYRAARKAVCTLLQCTSEALSHALYGDFAKWQQDEDLKPRGR